VIYPDHLSAARSLQFGSHRTTALTFNGGLRIENLNVQRPCDRRPVEDNERQDETAGPREHMDFILHLLFANEQLKLVV
jgi:hypothetical protein